MRWRGRQTSQNVQDRRGRGGAGLKIGGIGTILLTLAALFFGIDPRIITNITGGGGLMGGGQETAAPPDKNDEMGQFIGVVLKDTEDVWNQIFQQQLNRPYEEPKLVLFSGATPTACGTGQAAMGPFYCPADAQVYIDLSFYKEMRDRLGAPGDFAQAYVIAHEVGHHVQNLLGIADKVNAARSRISEKEANQLSVRMELQADCLAGVWAHHAHQTKNILEQGDVEEALNAATQIGDDALQKKMQGHVVPDSFTHGTSEQRVRWFSQGLRGGDIRQCDTFNSPQI